MKALTLITLLALSTPAAAQWHPLPTVPIRPWVQPQTISPSGFQTMTGTFAGQDVNLNTYGPSGFQTTTGTIGGQQVNCTTFGPANFQTTTCN